MSMSFNSSQSTSTPTVTETPENAIIDQISGVASGLAGQMLNWAQGVFAQTSAITNQAVGNFFNVSQQMLGLSSNLTGQYNNLFAPENAQLVADANSYASPARMAVDMGQAGATQAQAGDQALKNSEEALRSYGIDPSSGRYAALDKAAGVQNAANIAGAQNTQRNADIATGQKLRSEAVQVGAQLPAAIANVNNTAIQANTGASNATLANANTGKNLMGLPNDYLSTAMGVKLPLQGNTSQSTSGGTSSSPAKPSSPSSPGSPGAGGSGGGMGTPTGGQAWMPQHTGTTGAGTGNQSARGQSGAGVMHLTPSGQPDAQANSVDPFNPETGTGTVGSPTTDPFQDFGSGTDQGAGAFGNSFGQDFGNGNTFGDTTANSFSGDTFSGGQTSGGGGSDMSGLGAYNYDPNANAFDPGNNSTTGGAYDTSNWQDPPPQMSDPSVFGGGSDPFAGGSGQDYSGGNYDPFAGGGSYDPSSSGDYQGSSPSDMAMVRGGPVPSYASGGQVSPQQSPSGGQRVDDVRAQGPGNRPINLNANEFVIPQDVALWKGQEFFQNLIDQSRKRRMTASAQPTPAR